MLGYSHQARDIWSAHGLSSGVSRERRKLARLTRGSCLPYLIHYGRNYSQWLHGLLLSESKPLKRRLHDVQLPLASAPLNVVPHRKAPTHCSALRIGRCVQEAVTDDRCSGKDHSTGAHLTDEQPPDVAGVLLSWHGEAPGSHPRFWAAFRIDEGWAKARIELVSVMVDVSPADAQAVGGGGRGQTRGNIEPRRLAAEASLPWFGF